MATTHIGLSAVTWRRSSYCTADQGLCVEVADGVDGVVPVRDSKVIGGPVLLIPHTAWAPFVAAVAGTRRTGGPRPR
ncbi:DUF397 domain-containing protein [Streptomyces sp. G-G2]|uniref:DUF397 domain-containing protein n=1 Tax=Streptomyces sp. G-G2 TaxID=3046201 RepID=UPI0024BAABA6|nr:DUF397 domain-containing protein [Streptomyces sp. G-G2]MDJ0380706.1 DUF397 domain-containing protein [Streptomyces sp. G-G2]